jgi:hypothetical protein
MPLSSSITPDPLRAPTMAEIERAREMYAQGFAVARCLAAAPMSLGTLYYWLDGGPYLGPTTDTSAGGDAHGGRMLAPIPRRRRIVGKRRKPLRADRASLIARLTRTAERAALDIEQRLARPSPATPERERDLRMLASLVQSLRGLSALAPEMAGAGGARTEHDTDDPVPEDIDAFRLELARRIRGFIEERKRRKVEEGAGQAEHVGQIGQAEQ